MEPEASPQQRSRGPPSERLPDDDRGLSAPAQAPKTIDFYLVHSQATGADQCRSLYERLTSRGCEVWYDMEAQDLTRTGMENSLKRSRFALIFLSDGVMGRPFCQAELRWAKQYGCEIIGLVETDPRHNPADFAQEKQRAPDDLKHLLDDVEYNPYRRRGYEVRGMVDRVLQCAGMLLPTPSPMVARTIRGRQPRSREGEDEDERARPRSRAAAAAHSPNEQLVRARVRVGAYVTADSTAVRDDIGIAEVIEIDHEGRKAVLKDHHQPRRIHMVSLDDLARVETPNWAFEPLSTRSGAAAAAAARSRRKTAEEGRGKSLFPGIRRR